MLGVSHDELIDESAFRLVFQAAPDAYVVLSGDAPRFTIVAASDGYLQLTHLARADAIGRGVFEALPDANPANGAASGEANLRASLETVLRTRRPHRTAVQRYDVRGPDGTWEERYWAPLSIPIFASTRAESPSHILHTVEDVTATVLGAEAGRAELEQAYQQLQDQTVELEAQAEELRASAANLEEQTEEAQRSRLEAEAARQNASSAMAKYRALFETMAQGFCIVEVLFDREGDRKHAVDYRFIEANAAFERQTGLANAIGHTARELVPGLEGHWFETYGRVALTGEPARFEEGSSAMGRWFNVEAFRVGDPAAHHVAILFSDASVRRTVESERARLTAALELERARLATVFQEAPAFLAVLRGPDHVFTLVNPAYTRLVGRSDLIGKPAAKALPEVVAQGFITLLDKVLETGEPFVGREMPITLTTTPGEPPEERFLDFVYLPLVEPGGVRAGVIAHGTDVTEQVQARRQVERLLHESERARAEAEAARASAMTAQAFAESARHEADVANEAKSGFLATMSHELRTPINAILGYTQLLELGVAGPLTEEQRNYLTRLSGSGQHLLGLINDVLDLSKIEAGESDVSRSDARTGPPTATALDLVRPQADGKGVRLIDGRPDDEGVPFVGDEDRTRQIVLNLLGNAVKFTPSGGSVTVTCGTEAAATDAEHLQAGPWAYIKVADTGVGIPRAEQRRIFEPFHQVDARHTRTAGGTGLGLAISRRLARLMDGDLTVDSEPGRGSTFTLWLPGSHRAVGTAGAPGAVIDTKTERTTGSQHAAALLRTPGLGEVGAVLRAAVDSVLSAYVDRMRDDDAVTRGRTMSVSEVEDHAVSLLADLAQSLVIVDEAGPHAPELLRDGSAIQRTISDSHGARRFVQGFDERALRRDHQILREEVEREVRERFRVAQREQNNRDTGSAIEVDAALRVLLGLIDRAEAVSVQSWRRAAGRS